MYPIIPTSPSVTIISIMIYLRSDSSYRLYISFGFSCNILKNRGTREKRQENLQGDIIQCYHILLYLRVKQKLSFILFCFFLVRRLFIFFVQIPNSIIFFVIN